MRTFITLLAFLLFCACQSTDEASGSSDGSGKSGPTVHQAYKPLFNWGPKRMKNYGDKPLSELDTALEYKYDEHGRLIRFFGEFDFPTKTYYPILFFYGKNGLLSRVEGKGHFEYTYQYNDQLQLVRLVFSYYDSDTGKYSNVASVLVYTYDENGRLATVIDYESSENSEPEEKAVYSWNSATGGLARVEEYRYSKGTWKTYSVDEYTYESGKLKSLKSKFENFTRSWVYTWRPDGFLDTRTFDDKDQSRYIYHDGKLVKECRYVWKNDKWNDKSDCREMEHSEEGSSYTFERDWWPSMPGINSYMLLHYGHLSWK